MSSKRISFHGDNVTIEASGRQAVSISINADLQSLLDDLTAKEIVDHSDYELLLEAIGVDRVKDYFDLAEAE